MSIELILTVTESGEIHRAKRRNFALAAKTLINDIIDTYDDIGPEVFEGLFKLKKAYDWGDDLEPYHHFDFSCPEEQFTLEVKIHED